MNCATQQGIALNLGLLQRVSKIVRTGVVALAFFMLGSIVSVQSARAQNMSKNSSFAEPAASKRLMTDAQGKKIQVVDFDDAQIEGKAKAPDGFVLQSRQGAGFKNIMELRRNFRNQIESSSYEALVAAPSGQ